MKYRLKVIFTYLEILWSKTLILLGISRSTDPIPKNTPYCYEIDTVKNQEQPIDGYWIKPCKYHRKLKGYNAACTYMGVIGFDSSLGDQCKICGVD